MSSSLFPIFAQVPRIRWKEKQGDPWTVLPRGAAAIDTVEEGCGQQVGRAEVTLYQTAAANREADAILAPTAIVEDCLISVGSIDYRYANDPSAAVEWLWTGIVKSRMTEDLGAEGDSDIRIVTLEVEGPTSLLGRVKLYQRGVLAQDGSTAWVLGESVYGRNGDVDRVGNVQCLVKPDVATRATAYKVLQDALDACWPVSTGPDPLLGDLFPALDLSGQTGALDFPFTFQGGPDATLLDLVNAICHPSRGLTWWLDDGGGDALWTIDIRTVAAAPVTVGIYTLPTNTRAADLYVSGPGDQVRMYQENRPRSFLAMAGRCLTTLSLAFKTGSGSVGLIRGWDSADDAKAGDPDLKYSQVFREFRLDPTWNGGGWASGGTTDGSPQVATKSGRDLLGGRTWDAGTPYPVGAVQFDRDLVIPEKTAANGPLSDWFAGSASISATAPRLRPCVGILTGGTMTDVSDRWQVTLTNDPSPTIILGSSPADGAAIKAALGSGTLVVTLTIVDPVPMAVSARLPGDRLLDVVSLPEAAHWRVVAGTYLGPTTSGAYYAPSSKAARDDVQQLQSTLALLQAYGTRKGAVYYKDRGTIHPRDGSYRPGTLVTYLRRVSAEPDPQINQVITSRSWSWVPGSYGTSLGMTVFPLDAKAFK